MIAYTDLMFEFVSIKLGASSKRYKISRNTDSFNAGWDIGHIICLLLLFFSVEVLSHTSNYIQRPRGVRISVYSDHAVGFF